MALHVVHDIDMYVVMNGITCCPQCRYVCCSEWHYVLSTI